MTLPDTITNTLSQVLPLEQAARLVGLQREDLEKMVQWGQVIAFRSPEGHILIPVDAQGKLMMTAPQPQPATLVQDQDDINARLSRIRREDFAHLEGEEIGLSEAAREFGVSPQTIYKWVKRGYIGVVREQGRRKFLNKADVAFCVAVYNVRKPFGSRAPLLTEEGTPYLLKYPRLAALRRRAKNN